MLARASPLARATAASALRRAASSSASSASAASTSAAALPTGEHHGSRIHGSTHWTYERIASAALVPPLAFAMVAGAHPINDVALAVLLPIHGYMGMDTIVTDYVPKRKMGTLNTLATWALRFGTVGLAYGLWKINTEDVGVTEAFRRLWRAKEEAALKEQQQ
ncbi:CybS-domain-containing protein [Blastocladiella britannica]|nr:CybS-domain-containing protein [Blastocladiella britannica]